MSGAQDSHFNLLVSNLTDTRAEVRMNAAACLGLLWLNGRNSRDPTLRLSEHDPNSDVFIGTEGDERIRTLHTLGIVAIPTLRARLRDDDVDVCRATVGSLFAIGQEAAESCYEEIVRLLEHPNQHVRSDVVTDLFKLGPRAVESLQAIVALFSDASSEVRYWAPFGLQRIVANFPGALPILKSIVPDDRWPAVLDGMRSAIGDQTWTPT